MLRLIKSKFKGTITRVEAKNASTYLCLINLNPRLNHKKYRNFRISTVSSCYIFIDDGTL